MTKIDPFALVKEFSEAFDTSKELTLWTKLIREEAQEVVQAAVDIYTYENGGGVVSTQLVANLLKEVADLAYVSCGLANLLEVDPEGIPEAFVAIDMENALFLAEAARKAAMSVYEWSEDQISEAFTRVHASNMSKLGEDGKPVRREDGKILKGPNYAPPVLLDLVA